MNKSTDWVPTQIKPESGASVESAIITPDTDQDTFGVGQRVHGPTWPLVLLIPILLIFIPLGYQAGILDTLGYESKTLQGGGFTSTQSGYSLGLKTMYFRQGQTVFAEYDAEITAGSLLVRLYNYENVLDADSHFRHRLESTGKGNVTFVVEESGWYRLVFEGSVLGNSPPGSGYDIDYTVKWGLR